MNNAPINADEEALETLRLATEAANLGTWHLDVRTGEVHWSELSKAMFGVTGEKSRTLQDFWDRLHPAEVERVQSALQRALEPSGRGEYDSEYRVCRPGGEQRVLYAKGKAFFETIDGTRTATRVVGTLLDRTEQKLAQTALMQAEQMAATGRLIASISHEINNPLEAVTNLLYLLRDEIPGETGQMYLQQAESELARVSEIATGTLRFYRDSKDIAQVEVVGLTRSVLKLFQGRTALRHIEVQCRCDSTASVPAFQGQLRQVLVNLIGNAIDAMPAGGRLKIRCREFRSRLAHLGPGVGICIADNGTGMNPETLKRAFEPFFTTKGNAGTGLGLWLTGEILHKHGFKLRVKSKPGSGTVFSIYMPQTAAQGEPQYS